MHSKLTGVRWHVVLATLILVLLCSPPAVPQAADKTKTTASNAAAQPQPKTALGPASVADLEAFLDGVMAAHMPAQDIPTAVVSVVKDGKLFFAKGYGYADREKRTPVDPERTLFRPGSTSKLFTWTAVMQLHERGLLNLDADVNQYLKTFQIPATFPQPITMQHLLTHTPGFEDGGLGFLFVRSASELVPLEESLAAHIPWRVRPPGAYSSYSNYGTALAGLIVANISGMTFEEYVEKNIFTPLGMTHSTFREPLPKEIAGDMATGYQWKSGVYKKKDFEFIHNFGPAGALSSSANDMARFMIAHLQLGRFGDARILQDATAQQMHSQHYTLDPRLPGMAYGFYETRINGQRIIGHGGDTLWFHTDLALLPEHNLGLYVSYVTHGGRARNELLKGFLDRYFPAPDDPAPKAASDFKSRAARFAGAYRFTRSNWSTIEKLTALASSLSVSVTDDNTLLVGGLGDLQFQFVEVQPLLFQQLDGWHTLAFKENDRSKITHMFLDSLPFMPTYRVVWYEGTQFSLLLVGVGVLLCITTLVSAFYHRKESKSAPAASRWAIRFAAATGLLTLLFLVGLVVAISANQEDLLYAIPASVTALLVIPIVTTVLTLTLALLAVLAWTSRWWGLVRRIHFSLFALAMLALTWFYSHWNLLGFKY